MQGVDVLKRWRKEGRQMPVLILTARGSWTEKVEGLNAGADDYITKPSHVQEIAARLRALIRRAAGKASPTLVHDDIELSPASGTVTVSGKLVDLTAQEFRILNYFMHRQGRVISQVDLIAHLYPQKKNVIPIRSKSTSPGFGGNWTRRDQDLARPRIPARMNTSFLRSLRRA